MRSTALALVLGTTVLVACGGAAEPPDSLADTDEGRAGDVALRYVNGIVDHDWAAVCATRTAKERRELADLAGSCEKAFETIIEEKGGETIFDGVEVGDVRIEGTQAKIDLRHPGREQPAVTLSAVRSGGEWLLVSG